MEEDDERLVGIFIAAAVESAPQLPFIIRHRNKTEHLIISQMHSLFIFPFGSGKSALAEKIPNAHVSLSHTEPAIVGTISREGTIVKSDLCNAAKRVYVMDEAHRLNKKAMDAMLSLLENGHYCRSLGFGLRAPINEGSFKKDGWEVSSKDSLNSIDLRVRFSCVGFAERITQQMLGAFLSRFAIFSVVLDDTDIFKLMRGEGILKAGNVKKKYPTTRHPVEFNCYDDFVDDYEDFIMKRRLNSAFGSREKGYLARIGAHIAKLAVHFCRLDSKTIVEKKHYEKALRFVPLLVKNLKEVSLTPSLYNIYDSFFLRRQKQADIALELNVGKSYVSQSVKYLKTQGFIDLTLAQEKEEEDIEREADGEISKARQKREGKGS